MSFAGFVAIFWRTTVCWKMLTASSGFLHACALAVVARISRVYRVGRTASLFSRFFERSVPPVTKTSSTLQTTIRTQLSCSVFHLREAHDHCLAAGVKKHTRLLVRHVGPGISIETSLCKPWSLLCPFSLPRFTAPRPSLCWRPAIVPCRGSRILQRVRLRP